LYKITLGGLELGAGHQVGEIPVHQAVGRALTSAGYQTSGQW
jgi:hypothetical protein